MDFEMSELIPVWEESPEVYYDPVILEQELHQLKDEYAEVKYLCSEQQEEIKQLRKEIQGKEKEITDLNKHCKENAVKLPICQTKVLELNKDVNILTKDKKNALMAISCLKEKREELEKKYKDVAESNTALIITSRQLVKVNSKYQKKIKKEINDNLQTQAESDKTKDKFEEFELQIKAFKREISHHSDEFRFKEIQITELVRENKILRDQIENALIRCTDSEKIVRAQNLKIKAMNKQCKESILRYSGVVKENNALQAKLDQVDETLLEIHGYKNNERRLLREIRALKRMVLAEQEENKKLIEIAQELEKKKTRFIYTGEDMTVLKRKLRECIKKNDDFSKKFSNLDCPFYRSKFGQVDSEPTLKCGSLKERHYENKIFALEHVIKELHLKFDRQERKQAHYRRIVVKSLYDARRAEDKEKVASDLLEKQTYEIIYDKAVVLEKNLRINTLEIQKESIDNKYKVSNRHTTLLCNRVRKDTKKMESFRKKMLKANKVFEGVERKNDELREITEQSKKLEESMKTQLKNNLKCQERQQLEADEMQSTIEEFQEKFYKMQELLNITKQKNEELTNTIEQFKTSGVMKNKIQSQNMNEAKSEIGKLLIQNKKLIFEKKCLMRFEEENKLLQSKLNNEQQNMLYLQMKYNKLCNERERQPHSKRIPIFD